MAKSSKIMIIGTGQIGGSLGGALMHLKGQPYHIVGVEENGDHRQTALKMELVHEAYPVADFAEHCGDAELVVIATPLHVLPNVVLSCSEALIASQRTKRRTTPPIITDVGSVKSPLLTEFGGGLAPSVPFIGGHPIAGNEMAGPEAARADLFKDKLVVLTPVKKTEPKALHRVRAFWEQIGARVEEMTPSEHDQAMAASSHLPHILAYALIETLIRLGKPTPKRKQRNLFAYGAGGLKDFTRIAASSPIMWRDIAVENQAPILEALSEFKKVIAGMEESIARGDGPSLQDLFTRVQETRKAQ